MNTEIRLNKTERLGGVNATNIIPIDIASSCKPLVLKDIKKTVDLYDIYRKEYSECEKYRVILTIKPYCTNVLFNMCTEIVKDEGTDKTGAEYTPVSDGTTISVSSSVYGKTNSITRAYMVSNTEYSSPDVGYTYLPGYDILDNHTLRNLSFRPIMKPSLNVSASVRDVFNTVADTMRTKDGEIIKFNPRFSYDDIQGGGRKVNMHVYEHSNLLPFIDGSSAKANLITENGWVGFVNTSSLTDTERYSGVISKDVDMAHVFCHTINNAGNCDFIDMFPDRTRYSLVPKYNEFRNRYEKNWDIFLTYPWKNYYNHNLVRNIKDYAKQENAPGDVYALMAMRVTREIVATNRETLIVRTFTKHGLKVNDKVIIYLSKDYGTTYSKLPNEYTIDYVGDSSGNHTDYFFGISAKVLLNDIFHGDIERIFYSQTQQMTDEHDDVAWAITEVPERFSSHIVRVFRYELEEQPQGVTYDRTNTYDSMPKTVNQWSPVHIRVWYNEQYLYYLWNGSAYDSQNGANPQIEYGSWNTYTDMPEEHTKDYVRVKVYKFYNRLSKWYQRREETMVNDVIDRYFSDLRYNIRFVKIVNGVECKYYIRQFRKIPNLKYASERLPEGLSNNENGFVDFLQKNATDENGDMLSFDSETYNLAFSKTLYGDDVAQVTFVDTIDLHNLTDNLGRPVTEIYSTIVKRNKGYKVWYEEFDTEKHDRLINNDETEFSRCFGSLVTGFEYLDLDDKYDRNRAIRAIKAYMSSASSITRNDKETSFEFRNSKSVEQWDDNNTENEITEHDSVFFGDVVEYNPLECTETVLSDACFRFNTAQREIGRCDEGEDFNFTYHELSYDDYDPSGGDCNDGFERTSPFLVSEYVQWGTDIDRTHNYNPSDGTAVFQDNDDCRFPDRRVGEKFSVRKNEGYFYKPHHKIPLLKYGNTVFQGSHRTLQVKECCPVQLNGMFIKITTKTMHGVGANNVLYICKDDKWIKTSFAHFIDNYRFTVSPMNKDNDDGTEYLDWVEICHGVENGSIKLRVYNEDIPSYASRIGENIFVWRRITNPVDLPENDECRFPFSNNSFYVDSQVGLYLKRQDPYGINGLYTGALGEIEGKLRKDNTNEYKSEIDYIC